MMTRYGLLLAVVVSLFLCSACGERSKRSSVQIPTQVTSAPTPTQTVSDGCDVGNRIAAGMSCEWEFGGVSMEAKVTWDRRLDVTACGKRWSYKPPVPGVQMSTGDPAPSNMMENACYASEEQDGTVSTVTVSSGTSLTVIKYQNGEWVRQH